MNLDSTTFVCTCWIWPLIIKTLGKFHRPDGPNIILATTPLSHHYLWNRSLQNVRIETAKLQNQKRNKTSCHNQWIWYHFNAIMLLIFHCVSSPTLRFSLLKLLIFFVTTSWHRDIVSLFDIFGPDSSTATFVPWPPLRWKVGPRNLKAQSVDGMRWSILTPSIVQNWYIA